MGRKFCCVEIQIFLQDFSWNAHVHQLLYMVDSLNNLFFFFLITLVSGQPHSQLFLRKGSSTPTKRMLNPLWPRFKPRWRTVQLYLLYHQVTSAWFSLNNLHSSKSSKISFSSHRLFFEWWCVNGLSWFYFRFSIWLSRHTNKSI